MNLGVRSENGKNIQFLFHSHTIFTIILRLIHFSIQVQSGIAMPMGDFSTYKISVPVQINVPKRFSFLKLNKLEYIILPLGKKYLKYNT